MRYHGMEPSDFQLNKSSAQVLQNNLIPKRIMENYKQDLIIRSHHLQKKNMAKWKNNASTIKKRQWQMLTMILPPPPRKKTGIDC